MKMFLDGKEIKGELKFSFETEDYRNKRLEIPPGRYISPDIGGFESKDGKLWLDNGKVKDMPMEWDGLRYLPERLDLSRYFPNAGGEKCSL